MKCSFCDKPLKSNNKCGACYAHKHLSIKIKAYQKEKRTTNREERAQYSLRYRQENREKLLADKKIWSKQDRLAHPEKHRERQKKRNGLLKLATPKWLSEEQIREIEEFYELRKQLQWLSDPLDPLTVDHIIPLNGKTVCGLHVPWNLQILPHSLNCSKSIRLEG